MTNHAHIFTSLFTLCVITGCGLSPTAADATSIGFASKGYLEHGRAFRQRDLGLVRANPSDDTRWSTPLLAETLSRAARQVESRFAASAPLVVGDLSARGGGKHGRHGSHRTGRDADVLFYLADERGVSVRGSGFFLFDERGVSKVLEGALVRKRDEGLRFFDTARNWEFVRTLLDNDEAPVQWIFCSVGVKARLLRYAEVHERDPRLFVRASYVLHQPSRGNPHADHFHVRIACTAKERALGCLDAGPIWPWFRNAHEKPLWGAWRHDDATLLHALLGE